LGNLWSCALTEVRCVARGEDELGEGPAWSAAEARLYWFDIQGRRLNWLSPGDGARGGWDLPVRASVAIPSAGGGLVLITEAGLGRFDTQAGKLAIEAPMDLGPGFRTNDGKIDVSGRIWWSSMDDDGGKRPGRLFRTDPDGQTHVVLEDIHIANTVSCNPKGDAYYFADSNRRTIWRFPMSEDGDLGERSIFATTLDGPGAPDGSAVDAEGYLWNAQWAPGGLSVTLRTATLTGSSPCPSASPAAAPLAAPIFPPSM